jgi:hypothetical protein
VKRVCFSYSKRVYAPHSTAPLKLYPTKHEKAFHGSFANSLSQEASDEAFAGFAPMTAAMCCGIAWDQPVMSTLPPHTARCC